MTSGAIRKHKDKKDKKMHERKPRKKKKLKLNKSVHEEEDGINYAEDSGEGSVDLSEELHPIGYCINDREEMINQMFSIIKGDKLRAMLPPILKDSTIDELKSHCLDELLGMSSKRIHSVLEGRELETSSDSDDASSDPENENMMGTSLTENKSQWSSDDMRAGAQGQDLEELDKEDITNDERNGLLNGLGPDMDTLEIGITRKEMGELLNYMPSNIRCERKRTSPPCEAEPDISVAKRSKSSRKKTKEPEKQTKVTRKNIEQCDDVDLPSEEHIKTENVIDGDTTTKTDESKGKTLLEILELEMRARAIRALLKQQIGSGEGEDVESCAVAECDRELAAPSEVSPSPSLQLKECPSLNMANVAASSWHSSSIENAVHSDDFDQRPSSPRSVRQKLRHISNLCAVNTEHINNLCSTLSPKLSLEINAMHQLPSSTQYAELCSPTKIDVTVDIKETKLSRDVDEVANENSSQSDSCNNIKMEVIHGGETQDTDIVKSVPPAESMLDMVQCKEICYTTDSAVTHDEPDWEDGELSSDEDDKSSQNVLEVQPDSGCNDIIIFDESDDSVSAGDSQKLSLANLSDQDNCSDSKNTNITKMNETLNTTLEECIIKPDKSSISFEDLDSTTENAAAQAGNINLASTFIETEVNEIYKSENQKRKSDTTDCSWATRWLQSKDVQKVVSTSKMCAKIRKRMKSAQKVKKVSSLMKDSEERCKSSPVIVGSVNEYNMLDKPKSGDCKNILEKTSNLPEQNNT